MEKDNFVVDYLLEAEEDQFDQTETQETPADETDDQFSVDAYDFGDEDATEPMSNDEFGDEEMPTDETKETITDVDVNEIYTTISEFFETQDAEKVKEWIQSVVDTKHVVSTESFLDDFDTAEEMESSFNAFVSGETEESEDSDESKESETEEKEPEETSEGSEPEESAEKDETKPMDYKPMSESKTRSVVKEAYSSDLSRELQDVITARQSQTDPEVIQQLDAVINMMKEKLKAPAQQIVKPQTPVQESIRDRIRKRLAKK